MFKKIFLLLTTVIVIGFSLYVVSDLKNNMIGKSSESKLYSKVEDIKNVGTDLALRGKEKVVSYVHELAYKLVDDAFKKIEANVTRN